MLSCPRLAKCDDRSEVAKTNSRGGPEQWFTRSTLDSFGLAGITFDFFVDWNTDHCADEIWIKRLSSLDPAGFLAQGPASLTQALALLGDDLNLVSRFAAAHKLSAFYQVFCEDVDWAKTPGEILQANIAEGVFSKLELRSLTETMDRIRQLSGGRVRIGPKGLIYGTSTLECYLSHTDALWPGDVDCVLIETSSGRVRAILEYKKHNLESRIEDQSLINYYPRPDARKYDRLALLRDRLGGDVPIFVIYYSTDPKVGTVKIDYVTGPCFDLRPTAFSLVHRATRDNETFGKAIIDMLLPKMRMAKTVE